MSKSTLQKNMVKLWENSNPSNNFNSQTVSLNLSDYSMVLVVCTNDQPASSAISVIGSSGILITMNYDGNRRIGHRKFSVTSAGISFLNAFYSYAEQDGTANNAVCKPYMIFGIR